MTTRDNGPAKPPTSIKKSPDVKTPAREPEVLKENNGPVLKPEGAQSTGMAPRGVAVAPKGKMSAETSKQYAVQVAKQAAKDERARDKAALKSQVRTGQKNGPTLLKKDFDRAR